MHAGNAPVIYMTPRWLCVQFIIGILNTDTRARVRDRGYVSFNRHSAAGDLGLHHGLDGLFALTCDANGELIEWGHHGVMIEVNSTGDSSATEFQFLQFLQFRNGRWYLCNAQQESEIIMG